MRKIEQIEDAEDERKSERKKGVNRAAAEAVDQLLEELGHDRVPLSGPGDHGHPGHSSTLLVQLELAVFDDLNDRGMARLTPFERECAQHPLVVGDFA